MKKSFKHDKSVETSSLWPFQRFLFFFFRLTVCLDIFLLLWTLFLHALFVISESDLVHWAKKKLSLLLEEQSEEEQKSEKEGQEKIKVTQDINFDNMEMYVLTKKKKQNVCVFCYTLI